MRAPGLALSVVTDRDLSPSIAVYRRLSPSIALKRNCLAVDLTVSSEYADKKSRIIRFLYVPETIEWE
jgi:hypothetical protein